VRLFEIDGCEESECVLDAVTVIVGFDVLEPNESELLEMLPGTQVDRLSLDRGVHGLGLGVVEARPGERAGDQLAFEHAAPLDAERRVDHLV
jgi:hypothetical protein